MGSDAVRRLTSGAVFALIVSTFIISIIAIWLASDARSVSTESRSPMEHLLSREIPPSPLVHYLDSTAGPLTMTLPNDLSAYVGKVYRIRSRSAQPHVVRISTGGDNPTWDGTNTLATFGGAIGDGMVFEVVSKDRIVLDPVTNVAFS